MVDYLHSLRPTVNGEIFLTMIRLDKVTMLKLKLELSKDLRMLCSIKMLQGIKIH